MKREENEGTWNLLTLPREPQDLPEVHGEVYCGGGRFNPLLSHQAAEKMKVAKVNYNKFESVSGVVEYKHDTIQDFPGMSSGDIGTLPGSVQLTLKADKKQFVAHQKYFPFNYEERDRLVDTGVLAQVDEPLTG